MKMTMLWICASIACGVFSVMIYSIGTFRKLDHPASMTVRSTFAELLWAGVAIIIVIGAVAPAVKQTVLLQSTATPALLASQRNGQQTLVR